jgi:hypothetical protein
VKLSTDILARVLSERYWATQPAGLAARLRRGGQEAATEREVVAQIEASDLFDGGWYLRQQPDAVRARLSPAVHYVRIGAGTGAEPGPDFDTRSYLEEHPEVLGGRLAAVLHRIRSGDG